MKQVKRTTLATAGRAALYASITVLSTAGAVQADDGTNTAPMTQQLAQSQQGAETGLEEITVTAQRRSENLQSVPIAVTAITGADLANRQVTRTVDLLQYIPNMQGNNNSGLGTANAYYLRGIGTSESLPTFDPPVGTYIDEFYNARQNQNNFGFFDVDRIEVLRGPQGTLYGRNTTGGSINIYMKKPADTYGGYAEIGYGKYDEVMGRTSVDVPIVADKLLTKWSAFYVHDDGYVHDVTTGENLNYQHDYGLRGALEARFSDTATWDFSADYVNENYANLINFPGQNGGRVDYTPLSSKHGLGLGLVDPKLANIPLGNDSRQLELISNLSIELNTDTSLNVITGYHHYHQDFMIDTSDGINSAAPNVVNGILMNVVPAASSPLVTDTVSDELTQEIKFNGKAAGNLIDYVGGFYFFFEKSESDFATDTITPAGVATVQADRNVNNRTDAYAGYAQADFHVTDKFKATAGIRYTAEFKSIDFIPNPNPLPYLSPPFSTINILQDGVPDTQQAKIWTPRFVLNYQWNDDLLFYTSATKGFKSGGWNARSVAPQQTTAFGPEVDWTYEAGVKSDWLDNHLRVNLNGFYSHDANFQGASVVVDPVTNLGVFLTQNFATFKDYGVEGEVTALLTKDLNVYWLFGTQHSSYGDLSSATVAQLALCQATLGTTHSQCGVGIVTASGGIGVPIRTPPLTSTLGFTYNIPLAGSLELSPNAAWAYMKANWVASANLPGSLQPTHNILNAGLTLRDTARHWSLAAECTNCANIRYVATFASLQYLSEPGRWMVRARYDF